MNDIPPRVTINFKLEVKDLAVIIPLLSSAVALAWEGGYFGVIGGGSFTLFSLSEHIGFAVEALPIGILSSLFFLIVLGYLDRVSKNISEQTRFSDSSVTIFGYISGIVTAAMLTWLSYMTPNMTWLFTAGLVSLWAVPKIFILSRGKLRQPTGVIFGTLISLMALAFSLGWDSASSLGSTQALIETKEGEIKARIMRTGERGILYYRPEDRRFSVVPWVDVQRLGWPQTTFSERIKNAFDKKNSGQLP
jgi:hypothetical protein